MLTVGERLTYLAFFLIILILSSLILYFFLLADRGNPSGSGCRSSTTCARGNYCSGANSCIMGTPQPNGSFCLINTDCAVGSSCVGRKCVSNDRSNENDNQGETDREESTTSSLLQTNVSLPAINTLEGRKRGAHSFQNKRLRTTFRGRTLYLSVGRRSSSLIATANQSFSYDARTQRLTFQLFPNTSEVPPVFPATVNRSTGELYTGLQSSRIPLYSITGNSHPADALFITDLDGALLNAIDPSAEIDLIDSEPAYICSRVSVTSVPTLFQDLKYSGTQILLATSTSTVSTIGDPIPFTLVD